jgi:SAM-dependent methyltransferase
MAIQHAAVFRSDRIRVTENIIRKTDYKKVLEIGSGDYSFDSVKSGADVSWIKIDFSPPCDVVCDFNKEDCRLPFDDNSFDLIICTEVLEHLLWPQSLLREISRVLCENGFLLVSVPNIVSLTYRIAWLLGRIPSCAASGNLPFKFHKTAYEKDGSILGGHVIDFNLDRIVKLLSDACFRPALIKGSGIIWHRQLVPYWLVPARFASNIIILSEKCQISGEV